MAKYSGMIGYELACTEYPEGSGIYVDQMVERKAFGDLQWESAKWQSSGGINDKLRLAHKLTIVMDAFMTAHYNDIRYAMIYGTPWAVQSVEVQRPRLILNFGEEWNGPTATQI